MGKEVAWYLQRAASARNKRPETGEANETLQRLMRDPVSIFSARNLTPDAWQRQVLTSDSQRFLLLCGRQTGKSTTAAALGLLTALIEAPAKVLLLSRSLRQSQLLFSEVMAFFHALASPVEAIVATSLRLQLANGSQVISLPGKQETIRGYSGVRLLVVDEAAWVPDQLYSAVRPMLAVSKGRLVVLSSAGVKSGWFYDAWTKDAEWERFRVTASDCVRIPPKFLAKERSEMMPRTYSMEYEAEFQDSVDAVFSVADIERSLCDDIIPFEWPT